MIVLEEMTALAVIWLGLVSVVGYYVIRIGLMLRAQRNTERTYRLRLAVRARAVRESAPSVAVGGPGRRPFH